jgi:predicted aspartyl protease
MNRIRLYLAAVALALCATAAHAGDCQMSRAASLDMTLMKDGRILVPVAINGTPEYMLVDTGAPLSTLEADTVAALGLKTQRMYEGTLFNSLGQSFNALAMVPSLAIDQAHATNLRFPVAPTRMSRDPRMAGLLGADLLRHYDIELDFANRKLNLFLQDHCPGKVIYWPASTVAVVPVHIAESGHIIVPVQLDGQSVDAVLDTGAGYSILDLETAQHQFGLQPGTAALTPEGHYGGDTGVPAYSHVFKTLGFDGLAIANPKIYVFEQMGTSALKARPETGTRLSTVDARNGVAPMILGLAEMGHLHLFISYKEQKLYVTPPSPPTAATPDSASH